MAAFKPRFGTIKHAEDHRSNEFAGIKGVLLKIKKALLAGYSYPETEQLLNKPNGSKFRIKYTAAMIIWLVSIQVSEAGAKALLRIGAVLFNLDGNAHWSKLIWPLQNFIPLPPKAKEALKKWIAEITKHKPVAQSISCGGNRLRIIGQKGEYWIVEMLKTFAGKAPKQKPSTHPWLFTWLWEVDVITGKPTKRDLIWPNFSPTGKAYIHKSLVELI